MYRLEDFKTLTEWPMAHINEKWVGDWSVVSTLIMEIK